jgi:hypothetical protein
MQLSRKCPENWIKEDERKLTQLGSNIHNGTLFNVQDLWGFYFAEKKTTERHQKATKSVAQNL